MTNQNPEVLPTTDASYGKLFSRSQKMQARIASQRGGFDQNSDNNDNYRPDKDTYGGKMVPQRSARMLSKARSIKTFNQNIANINKNKNEPPPPAPLPPPPPSRISEESSESYNSQNTYQHPPPHQQQSPRLHQHHQQPPPPPPHSSYSPPPPHHTAYSPPPMQFQDKKQAALFEEFQERELIKLRELNNLQKQREEEERLLREEEASARLRELRLVRDNRLAIEREEEKAREAKRREEEEERRREEEFAKAEAKRLEEERKAREEEARIQELLIKQKKAAKKKKLQEEIDTLLDEEDLIEALQEQKAQILSGTLNDADMAWGIERLQNLERYLQARQQGVPPSPIRTQTVYSQPPVSARHHAAMKKNPTIADISAMTDVTLSQSIEETRNSLLDFDTKTEAELVELHQLLTNLESEFSKRHVGLQKPQDVLDREKREQQYKLQEARNGSDVQRQIAAQRAMLEGERQESDWAKANQMKDEELRQMKLKEAQLQEAQRRKEMELQRAHEMRQRLIDEERRIDEEDRLQKQRKDQQLIQEKEELVIKLQQKLDAEEKLRSKKEEYQKAKELQLQQERDLAERQRLLEKKQRLIEEKRRAQEEKNVSAKQQEMLVQKKSAAILLKEKESLIAQLQQKIDEEEKIKAKRENFKRQNSLKRQESIRKQEQKKQELLQRQESLNKLKKQVSFDKKVEVGVFQKQEEIHPVNITSDSDSDSDSDDEPPRVVNGSRGEAHYSFRDASRGIDTDNDNQTADLYKQHRSGLRPVNPVEYKLRSGFDTDDNTTDRNSQELKSAKFNYSNIGDDNGSKLKDKKSSFRAYDNPMASLDTQKPPPPPPKKRRDSGGKKTTGNKKNDANKAQPSVLSRWPPAQNGY